MIWPFKRQSPADKALAVMDDAVAIVAKKWLFFLQSVPFKDDVALVDKIAAFQVPASQGLRENFAALKDAPDGLLLLVCALGVERSGSHSREQIEAALGVNLP